jgi:hypothetical protein
MNLLARLGAQVISQLRGWGKAALFFVGLLACRPPRRFRRWW